MTKLLAAIFVAAMPTAAAAEQCKWYVNEHNPDSWIADNGEDFSVHFPGDGNLNWQFRIYEVEGQPSLKKAEWTDPHGAAAPSSFHFRFAEVNGKKAIIADMEFFYQSCQPPQVQDNVPKLPPA